MSEFGERVGGTYSMDDVLPRMAQLLGEATGAQTRARVAADRRRDAPGGVLARGCPAAPRSRSREVSCPDFGEGDAFEVRHQGELLGALTVIACRRTIR